MNGIKNILLLLVLTMVVSTMSASATPLYLCEQTINIGHSYGICDPANPGNNAQGTFGYDTNADSTKMDFTATAEGLSGADGTRYSLIYYSDTDPLHIAGSGLPVRLLDESTSTGGIADFAGTWTGGDIPAADDINALVNGGSGIGKIWIVPQSEIKIDGTLKWTGYGQGNTMVDYLMASDRYTETEKPSPEFTVKDRMGGITFNDGVVNTEFDNLCPTIKLSSGSKTSVSGINPVTFETTATLTPEPTIYPSFKWYVNGVLAVTDNPSGFVSAFDASLYNVNGGLVDITKTVRVDARTICTVIDAVVPAATASGIWTIEPQIKSIEVDVDSISFGAFYPGGESEIQIATVTNTGNVPITATVTASDMVSGANTIPKINVDITEPSNNIEVDNDVTVEFVLNVPADAVGGTYTGTVEFATS